MFDISLGNSLAIRLLWKLRDSIPHLHNKRNFKLIKCMKILDFCHMKSCTGFLFFCVLILFFVFVFFCFFFGLFGYILVVFFGGGDGVGGLDDHLIFRTVLISWCQTVINVCILRPQNINWQVWKYTSFVVFVGYSQNIRCHNALNAMCRDQLYCCGCCRKHWLKLQFSSWFSIHLLLHWLYRFYYQLYSIYKCVIIEYYVLHRSVSYWESLSCKMFLFSVHKYKWIENQLWKGISIQCFWGRPQQVNLRPLHCDLECFDCDRWKSQTMYISNLASECSAVLNTQTAEIYILPKVNYW